jgi:hypothetical protein
MSSIAERTAVLWLRRTCLLWFHEGHCHRLDQLVGYAELVRFEISDYAIVFLFREEKRQGSLVRV